MSRKPNIRWRPQDRVNLSKTVQQFNAKITREMKKNPDLSPFLPERLKVAEIKSQIVTRSDYNRLLNSYKRFLKKDATKLTTNKQGYTTTRWNRNETQYKINEINRQRKEERKRANVSTEKGTMGTIQANNLAPKQFNFNSLNPKTALKQLAQIDKMVKSTYMMEQRLKYYDNYKKAIAKNFLINEASILINLVNKLTPEELTNLYYSNPLLGIDFTYSKEQYDELFETIQNELFDAGKELGHDMTINASETSQGETEYNNYLNEIHG